MPLTYYFLIPSNHEDINQYRADCFYYFGKNSGSISAPSIAESFDQSEQLFKTLFANEAERDAYLSSSSINENCLACWSSDNANEMFQHNAWREAQEPEADLNEDGVVDNAAERRAWWQNALSRIE